MSIGDVVSAVVTMKRHIRLSLRVHKTLQY